MFWIPSYFTAYFLENLILAGLEAETFWVIGTHDNDYNKKFWRDQLKIFLIMLNWSIPKKWKFVDLKFI